MNELYRHVIALDFGGSRLISSWSQDSPDRGLISPYFLFKTKLEDPPNRGLFPSDFRFEFFSFFIKSSQVDLHLNVQT